MLSLDGFNKNQKKAVEFIDGACVVIAGAGSGKTRVLTYRIANLIEHGIEPNNILAVTFTKKASDEMKERLAGLIEEEADKVNMGTFHSICFRILRNEVEEMKTIELAKDWWIKKTVQEIMSPPSNKNPYGLNLDWQPRQAISFISFQKNNLVKWDETLLINPNIEFMETKLRKLYKLYEDKKKMENKIDFDDMLIMCYELFKNNPDIVAKYREIFKYVLVDEYQDTNLAQEEILQYIAGGHKNIFVVGDDKQSIYGFRASKVELIIDFKDKWNAEVIPLDINYRSTANIVEWSNKLIKNNKHQANLFCVPDKGHYKDPVITTAGDEDEEAYIIAEEIQQLITDGYKPQDFAILYRTNAQSRALEEAMMKFRLPYIVLGSANFYNRKEIKDMIAFMRLAVNPDDDMSLERVINTPNRFLGKVFIDKLSSYADDKGISLYKALGDCPMVSEWRYQGARNLRQVIYQLNLAIQEGASASKTLQLIRQLTDYDTWLVNESSSDDGEDDVERLENLVALTSVSYKFKDVSEFLDYIDSVSTKKSDADENGKIKLMSIHRSKGLEFPVVFITGVGQDLLPHRNAVTEAEVEEERRLMYVAMTRSQKLLYMSYTHEYNRKPCGRSMFIEELIKR